MSKANAKNQAPAAEAAQEPAPQSAPAPAGAPAADQPGAVVSAQAPDDEHVGKGGLYAIGADGRRTLVERTAPFGQTEEQE